MKLSASTRSLLIAAAVLVALFAIGKYFGFQAPVKEPRTWALQLDTAAIITIRFEDRADHGNDLELQRTGRAWHWISGTDTLAPAAARAAELLDLFREVKVKRDMGMIRLLGERYQLTDSTLCRITFITVEGTAQALNLGSTTFAPGKVGSWTYVNVPGEREVYAVEGLLTATLR
ncbi:MAG: hypothetical protein MUE88_11225 [Flavobacteriales bacterium]|jgi:hypothetical protein|nr:hypothetical protein [Flavobacteriales bacterium]